MPRPATEKRVTWTKGQKAVWETFGNEDDAKHEKDSWKYIMEMKQNHPRESIF